MSDRIVATEEVRDSLALQDIERPDEVAEDLAISVSTARRHLEALVQRGWAARGLTHGSSGRYGATGYTLTERGRRAFEENEGF